MDKFRRALKVAEGIQATTSPEMLAFLESKTTYEIFDVAFKHLKQSGKFEEALIASFPKTVASL